MLRFETDRLRFRALDKAHDLPIMNQWWSDPEILQHQTADVITLNQEETNNAGFERWFQENTGGTSASFCIVLKETDEFIGFINIWGATLKDRNALLGISIGRKDLWGQGYGREAMGFMLEYAFKEMNLHRITLTVHANNERGIRSYRAAGFVEEGRQRQAIYRDGVWIDRVMMGVLQDEYLKAHP